MKRIYLRGDMYYTWLKEGIGSEQQGYRPTVILQNNVGNKYSPTVIVATITSKTKAEHQPTHFFLGAVCGLKEPSVVLLEQLDTIDKSRLGKYIGHLDESYMRGIDHACDISLGRKRNESDVLVMSLCHTCSENFRNTGTNRLYRLDPKKAVRDVCTYCGQRSGVDFIVVGKR